MLSLSTGGSIEIRIRQTHLWRPIIERYTSARSFLIPKRSGSDRLCARLCEDIVQVDECNERVQTIPRKTESHEKKHL